MSAEIDTLPSPRSRLRLLAVVVLVMLPHLPRVPPWAVPALAALLAWRAGVDLGGWAAPTAILRIPLALAAAAGIYASYGRINGLGAGVSLLLLLTALKLTELRKMRDVRVLIVLLYFILVTHFLYTQALWMAAYLLFCAWLITAVLVDISHPSEALPLATGLRLGGALVLQALPLMAILFVLFPRIPGPLWGLPADSGASRSGLADKMSPDAIRNLILSDAVAFRVRFHGPPPARSARYWRGPVFSFYDGHSWRPGSVDHRRQTPRLQHLNRPVHYTITLEPSRSRWLFALDIPSDADLPDGARLDADAVVVARHPVTRRRRYTLISDLDYQLQPTLPAAVRRADLALPRDLDPRARALALRWRQELTAPTAIVGAALRRFHRQDFHYTLHPPPVGRDAIDDFLFRTHAGFCEQYASSFTFLMRAAGIPARVVTGYQGGSRNTVGDYYVVRNADAHAWSEVWLAARGWVRIDPTAAVSPARVDDGINAALSGSAGLPDFLMPQWRNSWRYALRTRWDWLNAQWDQWVLGYGPTLQKKLMNLMGLVDWHDMILALTAAITLVLAIIGFGVARRTQARPAADAAQRRWQRAIRPLRRYGLTQRTSESATAFTERVCRSVPWLSPWMRKLCAAFLDARYVAPDDPATQAALARAARRPQRR